MAIEVEDAVKIEAITDSPTSVLEDDEVWFNSSFDPYVKGFLGIFAVRVSISFEMLMLIVVVPFFMRIFNFIFGGGEMEFW